MSSVFEQWLTGNAAFLEAALAWLRLRLDRLADGKQPGTDADVQAAAAAMDTAATTEPPPALVLLARQFGLSRFEQEVLLLSAAVEFDTRIAALCAHAQADMARPYPTFALALALFDDPAWEALGPGRPLRYWRLLDIQPLNTQPLLMSPLQADERIVHYLKGLDDVDEQLRPLLTTFEPLRETLILPPSQEAVVTRVLGLHAREERVMPVVQLLGADAAGKRLVASHVAAALGLQLYRLPAGLLPSASEALDMLSRLWMREATLSRVALYLDAHDLDATESHRPDAPLHRFLMRSGGLIMLGVRESLAGLEPPGLLVDVAKPTPVEQQTRWETLLGTEGAGSAAVFAGQFDLNVSALHQVVDSVWAEPVGEQDGADGSAEAPGAGLHPAHQRLWDACRILTRPHLDTLAHRIEPKASWDDIVLPEEQETLMHRIVDQVRHRRHVYGAWGFERRMSRGLGLTALFAGDSGTGKTMAAEVLANDLRLDLYRIDLSSVVNKYIGETEKNLRRVFDAAEEGGAILFFDEADALFGKRSEVKDSHDRYANIEVNYLLQRMENYRGLAILASNRRSALDDAFLRRLRFIIEFPFPGRRERARIWHKVFPDEVPLEALDYEWLARFNVAGGVIHNIALQAAFIAAAQQQPVTMSAVLDAVRTEFRKLEMPINEAHFRWPKSSAVTNGAMP